MRRMQRLILHVDVDAFFASAEQLLIPALRGRCVVVGSGVIASCSYEGRAFGLRAGMPLHEARRRCPSAVFLAGRQPVYRCLAEQVWAVCRRFTCGLETYLDEAYGDATGVPIRPPTALGERLRRQVREEVGLPVSVGLAANRMMAKLASASAKPNGVAWVQPGEEEEFLTALPIERLLGVGPKTAETLRDMNISTVGELRVLGREMLSAMFGKRGEVLYDRCRGRDGGTGGSNTGETPVPRLPRSISPETTFHRPTCDVNEIRGMVFYLLERAMRAVRQGGLLARRVELSIRYDDGRESAVSRSLPRPTSADDEAFAVAEEMLGRLDQRRVALRHVGIVLSRFSRQGSAGELFEPPPHARRRDLYRALDRIRDRWGHAAVVAGDSIELLRRLPQNDYGFILRTPSLTK